jgi:hypothetical protein
LTNHHVKEALLRAAEPALQKPLVLRLILQLLQGSVGHCMLQMVLLVSVAQQASQLECQQSGVTIASERAYDHWRVAVASWQRLVLMKPAKVILMGHLLFQ